MASNWILQKNERAWYKMKYGNGILTISIPESVYDWMTSQFEISNPMRDELVKIFVPTPNDPLQLVLPLCPDQWAYGLSEDVTCFWGTDGWVSIKVDLPVVVSGGSNAEVRCFWDSAFRVSASLAILFQMLQLFDGESPCIGNQLLTVEYMTVDRDMWGGSLGAIISPALVKWLSRLPDNYDHPEVKVAMISAHCRMSGHPLERYEEHYFRAWIRKPCWINLSVPGNACGLDPKNYFIGEGEGFELSPHNTDNPIQQLSLLAGLATLYEIAR